MRTPPLYTFAAKMPSTIILIIKITIPNSGSQNGKLRIPTRMNMIIGVKKGIYDVIVIKVASGVYKPNMANRKPMTINQVIGAMICGTSSMRLTSEPNKAARVAYRKNPSKKKIMA